MLLVHLNGFAQAVATVAAASDLKFALDDLIRGYEARSGHRIRAVYGSSGNLARQIEQGAPFDVFMSADEAFVDDLARKGLTDDAGSLYGIGRIVLYSSDAGVFAPDASFDDLRRALARGRVERFAIANPEHAPYGRAAREALMATGLWTALSGRLVLGENVSQAAQFAVGGNAQGGVFALSLALAPTFPRNGSYVVVPESLHAPLRQKMVVLKRAPAAARTFHAYLRSPEARAVLERHGFTVPGN
ncbi:MAG TPA: molybdate ABC transporter substrate-binding protein [Burkholderiaceae bacterium]|nr:molybdate ABC transporter substrate-binding protein [Burkholderiaceae bacterium]